MLESFTLIIFLIGVGTLMKRSRSFPENTAAVLNMFVLRVSLPAMILISIPSLPISSAIIFPVLSHWVLYGLNIVLVLWACSIFKFSRSVKGALLIVSCLGNTAFLGTPMVTLFWGAKAVPYAVLYDQLGSGLAFIGTMAFLVPRYSSQEKKSLSGALYGLLKFPPFIALIFGFIFIYLPMPTLLELLFKNISVTLIPCAMIAVGYQMKYRLSKQQLVPLGVGLTIKLIILPTIAFLFVKISGLQHLALSVSVLQSGMPPMITAGALAMSVNLENDLSTSLVGYGLIIAFITLPLLNYII
ncbi:MAG: AEC family transporter [Halobacteriovoraceae bacterium]|jgi:malate permease and related proteins|nr:AEC family transporter [Halobacteriovoraceae bacterium]